MQKKQLKKLVNEIFNKVNNTVTEEFGEYLVSISAKDILITKLDHKNIPLAELWKEKISGNPGFDFHTESPSYLITFGEAKYSSSINPHTHALSQIVDFINEKKDEADLIHLRNFASCKAVENAMNQKKAFVAAFSLNGTQFERIFNTVLTSSRIEPLLEYPELYIIGVEI